MLSPTQIHHTDAQLVASTVCKVHTHPCTIISCANQHCDSINAETYMHGVACMVSAWHGKCMVSGRELGEAGRGRERAEPISVHSPGQTQLCSVRTLSLQHFTNEAQRCFIAILGPYFCARHSPLPGPCGPPPPRAQSFCSPLLLLFLRPRVVRVVSGACCREQGSMHEQATRACAHGQTAAAPG